MIAQLVTPGGTDHLPRAASPSSPSTTLQALNQKMTSAAGVRFIRRIAIIDTEMLTAEMSASARPMAVCVLPLKFDELPP